MKGTKICLLLLLISIGLFAQNGWIETYSNAQFGLSVKEYNQGYNIAGFKGVEKDNVLFLHVDSNGIEHERLVYSDFNSNHTYQENNVELLLTEDGGLLVSAYNNAESVDSFIKLLKFDFLGNLEWSKQYIALSELQEITVLSENEDGYYLGINERDSSEELTYISSVDNVGEVNWVTSLDDSLTIEHISLDSSGHPILLCSRVVTLGGLSYFTYFIIEVDTLGNITNINVIEFDYGDFTIKISDFLVDDSNKIYLTGWISERNTSTEAHQLFTGNINNNGVFNSINAYQFMGATFTEGLSIIKAWDEGLVVAGRFGEIDNNNSWKSFYLKVRENGLTDWSSNEIHYDYGYTINDVITTSDSGYLFVGRANQPWGSVKAIKTNNNGQIQTNRIDGFLFKDVNQNCLLDTLEPHLKNFTLHLTNTNTNEVQTQRADNYDFSFKVDTGTYLLEVVYFESVWDFACDPIIIEIEEENTEVEIEVPLTANFECPLMAVDLTTPILRRCEQTNYKIQVFNNGTVLAENPYVDLELDPSIELIESSRPFTIVNEGLYRFQLGNMNVSEGRIINLVVEVDCDSTILGQTHCVAAYVYPDTACFEIDPEWDGSVIDVDGDCLGDSVLFRIQNKGQSNMIAPKQYYVIEDEAIFRNGNFQLNSGESEFITVPADGKTYRIETDENPGYIFEGRPSYTVEICGAEFNEDPSLGFVNSFPMYDNSPFVSIDCQENIQDLTGNFHIAYPTGYSDENIIREGDVLEYFIRFENTTLNTVKNVTIIDTLDDDLDVTTLNIGVTSHPYIIKVEDENILKITFNNINLSQSVEEDNYGFVKFKIAHKADLPIGTKIENQVQIILDAAIIETGLVFHTLGEELSVGIVDYYRENLQIEMYPNPINSKATIEIKGNTIGQWTMKIYSVDGQFIRSESFNGNVGVIQKKHLNSGIYIFTIEDKGGLIGSGKMIVQ